MGAEQCEDKKVFFTNRLNFLSLGKGMLAGYLFIIPAFAILAYILSFMKYPEKYMTGAVIVVTIISITMAGYVSAATAKTKGLLNGALTGFLYYLLLFLLSSITLRNYNFGLSVIISFITSILAGSLGGVLGVNFKKKGKHRFKRA